MKVNEKIRFFRKLNGWSQEEVAIKLNMSPNGYGNIERGDTDMPLSRLSQIAQLFGVEEADFFTATEKISLTSLPYTIRGCNKMVKI
jgi:transcriptional regulator with XRE-family HTH domain